MKPTWSNGTWNLAYLANFLEIPQKSQDNTFARVSFWTKKVEKIDFFFASFLRPPFLTEHLRWLLLQSLFFNIVAGLRQFY